VQGLRVQPVEQIVLTINIGLRRQISQLTGSLTANMPPGLLTAPPDESDQIQRQADWGTVVPQFVNKRKLIARWPGINGLRGTDRTTSIYGWRALRFAFSTAPTPFTKCKTATGGDKEASPEDLAPLMDGSSGCLTASAVRIR
jgi:hypothetical protein